MLRECVNASLILPKKKTLCLLIARRRRQRRHCVGRMLCTYMYIWPAVFALAPVINGRKLTRLQPDGPARQQQRAQQRGASPRRKDVPRCEMNTAYL